MYSDKGKSAGRKKKREYLDILLEEIKQGKISNIVSTSIDRVSRSNIDYLLLAEACEENDVVMHMLDVPIDINSSGGKIAHTVKAALAEEERTLASIRAVNSFRGRLEKGKYPYSSHRLPLGISKDEEHKLYYNDDIKIVKEVFSLYESGCNFKDISDHIKLKYPNIKMYKNKIEYMIKNTIYYGYREFKGEKFYLIEPIASMNNNIELEKQKDGSTRIRAKRSRINHKYDYTLQGKVVYRKKQEVLYVQTKIKPSGRMYKYLYTSDGHYYNEKLLLEIISYYINQLEIEVDNLKNEKLKRIQKLYVNGDIQEEEYEKLKYDISISSDTYTMVDKAIEVDEHFNVFFQVKGKELNFNYKEEQKDFK